MPWLKDIRYELPDIKRALVLSPHPDDETLGCGGTIALYSASIAFTVVALSLGEAVNIEEDNKAVLRKTELENAMKVLGVRDIVYLNIPDGEFQQNKEEIKEKLTKLYRDKNPDIVFSPSPTDIHPDHEAAANVCIELSREFPAVKTAFYEIYNQNRFNTLIDIGRVIDIKKEALGKYHYSMLKKEDVFISSCLSLNRAKAIFTLNDSYYEAFRICDNPADISPLPPEDRLLNSLKTADLLIHRLRVFESEIKEKDEEIQKLSSKIKEIQGSLFRKIFRKF